MTNLHPWIPKGVREPDVIKEGIRFTLYRWKGILDVAIFDDGGVHLATIEFGPPLGLANKINTTTTSEPFPQELFEMIKL